jgi:hypothetical protein
MNCQAQRRQEGSEVFRKETKNRVYEETRAFEKQINKVEVARRAHSYYDTSN